MKLEAIKIIGTACIWGFTMIMCSLALKGTGMYQEIQLILSGGTIASIVLSSLGVLNKTKK